MFVFLPFVRFQNQVSVDDHPYRETWPDRQRWSDIQITLNDFLPSLIQTIARPAAKRLHDVAVVAGVRARSQFATHSEQRGEHGRPEQSAPAIVDPILETRVTRCIGAGPTLKHDGPAIRHDQAGPNQQHA
jgi:hypothetical protein